MLFMDLVNQDSDRIGIQQIHIILSAASRLRGIKDKQAVRSRRQIEIDKTVLIPVRQIQDSIPADGECLPVRLRDCQYSQQFPVRLQKVFHQHRSAAAGTADIHMAFRQIYLFLLRVPDKSSVGL